jgi:ABC-2 type transport system ATP-binding protein
MEPAIFAQQLRKRYGEHEALKGIDLSVPPGTVFGLLGPNGSGKTTTVRILATLLRPDGGRAAIAGFDVHGKAREVRRRIGLTGQYAAVDERLTGRENLQLIGVLLHLGRRRAKTRAAELLHKFQLDDAADRPAKTYSGGMRRRLDLAASLITQPEVLFLDEPTTGLDLTSRLALWEMIREQVGLGVTVLLTTQYLEEADQLADRIAVLDSGRIIAEGTSHELKQKVGGERLEVTVATPAHLSAAYRAMASVALEAPTVDETTLAVSAPLVGGVKSIAMVANDLEIAGVEPTDFAVRRSSLDDVFLALTGHAAESAPTGTDDAIPVLAGRDDRRSA